MGRRYYPTLCGPLKYQHTRLVVVVFHNSFIQKPLFTILVAAGQSQVSGLIVLIRHQYVNLFCQSNLLLLQGQHHPHQMREGVCLHLLHYSGAMGLNGGKSDSQLL